MLQSLGVGGHSVLQKSVEWETGVEGKKYYFWRFFYYYKGISEGWSGWAQRAPEKR